MKVRCAKRRRLHLRRRLALESLEDRKLLATLTVTNANDSGPGSLRDSIQVANTLPGQDVIEFQIGSGAATINVLSELPAITESLIIDGWTQPGFDDSPLIELDGSGAGASAGLIVSASQTTIRGLVINDFFFAGIFLTPGTNNSVVEGCYLGTSLDGAVLEPNNAGLFILSSDGNRVGTNGDGVNDRRERNLITGALGRGNNVAAVYLQDSSDNVIAGNFIGTNVTGKSALANHERGIEIRAGSGNVIGTNGNGLGDAVEGNVISGASESGVFLVSTHSRVAGNFIGTDKCGKSAIPNKNGVLVFNANNTIGTNGDGLSDDLEGNVISGNLEFGISVLSDSTVIAGNYVGTDATGTKPIPNEVVGVRISASNNRVGTDANGTSDVLERNVISGNYLGVNIQGDSRHNVVAGNYIGTDVEGDKPIRNYDGVRIDNGASFNRIGADGDGINDSVEANVIAANEHFGVVMRGGNVQNNVVAGNFIGTNKNFNSGLHNLNDAVAIFEGANSNRVERNTIFGNEGFHGVVLGALAPGNSDNNIVSENNISNFYRAIYAGGDNNQIRSNTLTNNSLGLLLTGNNNAVTGNIIQNHTQYGIRIEGSNNRIGGSAPADANVISITTNAGVEVIGIDSVGNSIRGNSIHTNGGLGIDLGGDGPTSNDPDVDDDVDSGPNNFQNYPVLTFAQSGANTRVIGSLSSGTNAAYTIDFYANPIPYSANDGEGRNFLGSLTVTTNGIGEASFDTNTLVVPLGASPTSAYITATATDSNGNTSEFSAALQTISNQFPTAVAGGPYSTVEGTNVLLDGSGSFDTEDGTSLTYEWDLDYDGIDFDVNATGVTPTVSFQDNFVSRLIALRVTDSGSLSHIATTTIAVSNATPIVSAITAPLAPVELSATNNVNATFTDLGNLDAHTAVWDWGDGSSSSGTVIELNGAGTVTGNHSYASAGVYTITLTVIDDDTGAGQSQFQYLVIYDPSAGFVTGGGWFTSPLGAFASNPDLTGKANFGFESKYQKGNNVPTGNTEFQFKLANFNFKSTAYDWLVVNGAKARYRGVGTVNGTGSYGFELTAWDGQINGGGGLDKLRIKIWLGNQGNGVVYDNMLGAEDGADPTTALGGGSIVIHRQGQNLVNKIAEQSTASTPTSVDASRFAGDGEESLSLWYSQHLNSLQVQRGQESNVDWADLPDILLRFTTESEELGHVPGFRDDVLGASLLVDMRQVTIPSEYRGHGLRVRGIPSTQDVGSLGVTLSLSNEPARDELDHGITDWSVSGSNTSGTAEHQTTETGNLLLARHERTVEADELLDDELLTDLALGRGQLRYNTLDRF